MLPITEVNWINMPRYDELSVLQIMPEVEKFPEVMRYFPNNVRKVHDMNRVYFFNVLNTVVPEYCQTLLCRANAQRNDVGPTNPKMDCIEISDDWYKKLMEHPYVKSKSATHT